MIFILLLISIVISIGGCAYQNPANSALSMGSYQVIYPHYEFPFQRAPIFIKKKCENNAPDRSFSGQFNVECNNGINYTNNSVYIKKGIGSALVPIYDGSKVSIINSDNKTVDRHALSFNNFDTLYLSNDILNSLNTINENTLVFIYNDILIPSDKTLTIRKNVVILVSHLVNIVCEGNIICEGTLDEPITFAPFLRESPWGGVVIKKSGFFSNTIFTGGGGNTSGEFVIGHSKSQAVIHAIEGDIEAYTCFFAYNFGKGVTGVQSNIKIDSSFFSFCDMGGEFEKSCVNIYNSYFLFVPDDTENDIDDDNDALYFLDIFGEVTDSAFSIIDNCIFYYGKDDAIDHNGAFLHIKNSWIEKFTHEGLAGSNDHCVKIYNSYFTKCEQGVEAGYGKPSLCVNHCLITNNDVGVRFGDSYDWGCAGHINTINSIIYDNKLNVRNFDLKTNGPIDSAIEIHYSLIDSSNVQLGVNNIPEDPILLLNLLLDNNSPGKESGNDSLDIGLTSEL